MTAYGVRAALKAIIEEWTKLEELHVIHLEIGGKVFRSMSPAGVPIPPRLIVQAREALAWREIPTTEDAILDAAEWQERAVYAQEVT